MSININWFVYNQSLNFSDCLIKQPEKYILKISKNADLSGKRTLVVKEKTFMSYLEKYFYSGDYTYNLNTINTALQDEYDKQPETNPSSDLLSCISIFDKNVDDYERSTWTKIIGRDPKVKHIKTKQNPSTVSANAVGVQSLLPNSQSSTLQSDTQPPASPPQSTNPLTPDSQTTNPQQSVPTNPPAVTTPSPSDLTTTPPKPLDPLNPLAALPAIPKDGIKVGLPNITDQGHFGNTCWLNSVIKFMVMGNEFDEMFAKQPPAGKEEFQRQFKTLYIILRTGKTLDGEAIDTVPYDIYKKFIKTLKDTIPGSVGAIGEQQDALKFFVKFGTALNWTSISTSPDVQKEMDKSRNYPRSATQYSPLDKYSPTKPKSGRQDASLPYLRIKTTYKDLESETPLDLQSIISSPETIEDLQPDTPNKIPDLRPRAKPDALRFETFDYTMQRHLTCLPKSLMVFVDRLVVSPDDMQKADAQRHPDRYQKKVLNPILLDENGYITLTEYLPTFDDKGQVTKLTPHKKCSYRIDTALTHDSTSAKSGHYICQERSAIDQNPPVGKMTKHSDNSLTEITNPKRFGIKGDLLRLTLVKEEILKVQEKPAATEVQPFVGITLETLFQPSTTPT